MWKSALAIFCGGGLGALARAAVWHTSSLRFGAEFPLGTLIANVSGCFLIGFFAALPAPADSLFACKIFRQFLIVGVLGGYTTFSSFSLQTLELVQEGKWFHGLANVALSLLLSFAAVWAGTALGSLLRPQS